MQNIHYVIIFVLCFFLLSIFLFCKKRKKQLARAQLRGCAKRYFITICYKLLTPFDDECIADKKGIDYVTFRICDTELNVILVNHTQDGQEFRILLTADFCGNTIVDISSGREFSYGSFENFLAKTIGDLLVYDSYVRRYWEYKYLKTN